MREIILKFLRKKFEVSKMIVFLQHKTNAKMLHYFSFKGFPFRVEGKQNKFGELQFDVSLLENGRNKYGLLNRKLFKASVLELVEAGKRFEDAKIFRGKLSEMSLEEKISDERFAYARYKPEGQYLPASYALYWKDQYSPTGVQNVGGCSVEEWESASANTGNAHNYLAPGEKW